MAKGRSFNKERKGKERKSIYITPFIYYVYLKVIEQCNSKGSCNFKTSSSAVADEPACRGRASQLYLGDYVIDLWPGDRHA